MKKQEDNGGTVRTNTDSEQLSDAIYKIDVEGVLALIASDPPQETIDELYDFGKFLLDQARSLRSTYDSKLTNCLGWASGLLAFVLVGKVFKGASGPMLWIGLAGAISATMSVLAAIVGVRSKPGLKWPSAKDWLNPEYTGFPKRLKGQYIIAIFEAQQSYISRVQEKGYCLAVSEYSLAAAGCLLGLAVIYSLFLGPV